MSLIEALDTGQGYLKAGFLGFQKSGKTWTSAILACGVKNHLKLDGPIVMFDTEGGSGYIAGLVQEKTGTRLAGKRSRSFDELLAVAHEAEHAGASVFIADSMTHVWRELCAAHLKGINEVRRSKGQGPRTRLEFQDWNPIKEKWARWTDWYLNSKMHVVICGRAGYEYDMEEREDGSGKDLVKTGIKMKTEGEFGFEPSLLIEMERVQLLGDKTTLVHRATVIGDRFGAMDAAQADNPDFSFFLPHVSRLTPGAHAPIDVAVKSDPGIGEDGDAEWGRERKARVILCEEIQGELLRAWPGQTAAEKKAKVEAIERAFGTRSWTAVESLNSETLRVGLETMREIVAAATTKGAPEAAAVGGEA